MAEKAANAEQLLQMRMVHLGLIQDLINRLAGYSATLKTFCITIVAGLLALAADDVRPLEWTLTVGVILLFAVLDAYYLSIERDARSLYSKTVDRPLPEAGDMHIAPSFQGANALAESFRSPSVFGFYLPLALFVLVMMALFPTDGSRESKSVNSPPRAEVTTVEPTKGESTPGRPKSK